MTDSIFKGGRGQKAPYISTHLRVPEKIKTSLQKIIDVYKRAYQLNADDLILRLEASLVEYANNFSPQYNSLVDSKSFVPFEKYRMVLYALDKATQDLKCMEACNKQAESDIAIAVSLLEDACTLKSNAGGAIKKEIRKAIEALD